MKMCHLRAQNGPFVLNKICLVETIIITLMCLLALFNVQNLKQFFQQIQSYEDPPFLCPNWSICPPQKNFLGKLLIPFSSTYKPVSLRKILKKFQIFGPKMAHFPKWNFFSENLLMSLVSFIQAFLHVRY